jgi:peptidyl-Asp metalloendopeptidase
VNRPARHAALLALAALFLLPLALQTGGKASAQSGGLFSAAAAPVGAAPETSATVVRRRPVTVNFSQLTSASVVLNLFDNVSLTATRDRLEPSPSGGTVWVGRISGNSSSSVTLVANGAVLTGTVSTLQTMYQITTASGPVHWVKEIRQAAFLKEQPPRRTAAGPVGNFAPGPVQSFQPAPGSPNAPPTGVGPNSPADPPIIDLAVFYTADARTVAGGQAAIDAEIDLAIVTTNQAYLTSGIIQRVRLVHRSLVTYTESGDSRDDVDAMQDPGDGLVDEIPTRRDAAGADIAVMLVANLNACGEAFDILDPVSTAFADNAFTVVERSCASSNFSFPHEIGHLVAARHDWFVDNTDNSPYTYNHGYTEPGFAWRTIMAYNDDCVANEPDPDGCPRLGFFSNPDRLHTDGNVTGVPEGMPNAADNRKTHNNTAETVAQFRACVINCKPRMSLTNVANPTPLVQVGQTLTYTFTVRTLGDANANTTTLKVQLPSGFKAGTATIVLPGGRSCQLVANGSQLTCNLGAMVIGETVTVTLPGQATGIPGTNLCSTAQLNASNGTVTSTKQATSCSRVRA